MSGKNNRQQTLFLCVYNFYKRFYHLKKHTLVKMFKFISSKISYKSL